MGQPLAAYGLTAAEEVMSRWTGAFYDYADAPEGSPTGLLGAGAPLRDVTQDVMSSKSRLPDSLQQWMHLALASRDGGHIDD
jgi:hypothetical protein